MAGSFSALFMQEIMETVQQATGAPATLTPTTTYLILTHTTLNDATLIGDTGWMGGFPSSTDFQQKITNSTATWTLANATSPIVFQNKVDIVISTGNFSAPSETTIKGWLWASTNSTSAGRIYAWGDVTPNQVVSTGNPIQFSTGALVFRLGGTTGGVAT